jgi:tetratricopeptide (TPR) repeat protein
MTCASSWRAPHQRLADHEAIRVRQAALLDEPGAITRCVALALAYAERSEYTAARQILERAMRIDSPRLLLALPFDAGAVAGTVSGTGDQSHESRSRVEIFLPPMLEPDAEMPRLWLHSYLDMTQGRFAEAAQTLEAARQLDPQSASLQFYMGLAELGQQRYEAALASLEAALGSNPTHLASRVALGLAHLQRGRFTSGRKELEMAVAAAPDDAVAQYLLGRVYLRQREMTKAVEALQAAVAADPTFLDTWFVLAQAYRLRGLLGAAADAYREIIRQRPGQFDAHYQLASLFKHLGDNIAFQWHSDQEKAPPPDMTTGQWHAYLAALQRRSAEYGQLALSEFAIALSIQPAELEAIRQVCEIYRRSGQRAKAQKCFVWLAHRQPEQWIHLYRLGTILLQDERHAEAIRPLQRALALEPTQGDAYFALGWPTYARVDWRRPSRYSSRARSTNPLTPPCTRILARHTPATGSKGWHARRSTVPWISLPSHYRASISRIPTWRCCTSGKANTTQP